MVFEAGCFLFRWMKVLERVVKLELPPDDDEVDAAETELPVDSEICENVYETIDT